VTLHNAHGSQLFKTQIFFSAYKSRLIGNQVGCSLQMREKNAKRWTVWRLTIY